MNDPGGALAVIARIRRAVPAAVEAIGERCDLCAGPVDVEHGHLVDVESRTLRCVCRACYLLFVDGRGRLRSVPDRYVSFPDLPLTVTHWDALQIPVSVAFFFFNSTLGRIVALYPGPAGATESLLPLDAWADVLCLHPALTSIEPDVEALLLRAERGGAPECFIVPIDVCYELVGRLRTTWRGFDGGADARATLTDFFRRVHERARPASGGLPPPPEASP